MQLDENPKKQKFKFSVNIITILVVVFLSFYFLEVNLFTILASPISMISFLLTEFLPPNFRNFPLYLPVILETIYFAISATFIAAVFSFVFGVLISENFNRYKWLRVITRYFISFIRSVPVLIWAQLIVFVFGIGNIVGLLALVLSSVGFLSRSYAESIDDISTDDLEGIKSTGASYMQVLIHGLIPEFATSWLNWTLFSFEINIRISAILGIVGAGGIGAVIQTNLIRRNFEESSALIITLIAIVLVTEWCVGYFRKKIK